ncbi:hypothetical protein scyTo_0010105 [Scyliorhinus torazame]|uniref:Glypican-3 alpha subunit n=1 Tax=Scyliorhinus torazame TaxID=75743 RepID=A0A401P044_SCYTO|nr:hypothetical protein [Scyliorhinus torazame]
MKRPCCGSAAVLLLLLAALAAEPNCEEVKKVFQLRQIGPSKWLPETPRSGSDLQVCTSEDPTCCTRKMEERYQAAVRQDIQNLLQTSSSTLKFLISRNAAAFQVLDRVSFGLENLIGFLTEQKDIKISP